METPAIHRIIERHAATDPTAPAIVERHRVLTYRELNYRANACARYLVAAGFKRGAVAEVPFPRGCDTAIALFAVIKAGGSYTWIDEGASARAGRSIAVRPSLGSGFWDVGPRTCADIDLRSTLESPLQPSPNLPVLTRGSDVACVLCGTNRFPEVVIPHATIVGLRRSSLAPEIEWTGEPGAIDLWLVLMACSAAIVDAPDAVAA